MKESRESRVSTEGVTNTEIASAIRYLDPDYLDPEYLDSDLSGDPGESVLMICLSLIILCEACWGSSCFICGHVDKVSQCTRSKSLPQR